MFFCVSFVLDVDIVLFFIGEKFFEVSLFLFIVRVKLLRFLVEGVLVEGLSVMVIWGVEEGVVGDGEIVR